MSAEKRLAELEARAAEIRPGLTEAQRRCADRYVRLLIQQREIPKRLREQFKRVPREGPLHPAIEALIERVMEKSGPCPAGKTMNRK